MANFYDISLPVRSLILLAYFLVVCLGGRLIPMVLRRKKWVEMALVPAGILICGVLMIIYTAEARARRRSLEVPAASDWLCRQPVLIPLGLLLAAAVLFSYLIMEEWRYRKNTITRSAIKEGVDKMSSGLCFFENGGRVILVNNRMNELCHAIVGGDLQNAETFWHVLSGGGVRSGVERISFGSYPNFRMPDGTVWTFAREVLDGFNQLTAVDTTLQQALTDDLREKNLDLAAMNLRLRRYGENVDELARARERLETKVRIHGELGQALLAARRYLLTPDGQKPPLEVWRRNIAMLRKEMEAGVDGDPLLILRKAAQASGIRLEIIGNLPQQAEYRQFFLTAASEAMTNAVFHANAKSLCIELSETADGWRMRFTNDGANPEKAIVEGGGLSSLRRKAEYIGVVMSVENAPEFALVFEGKKG